MKIRRWILWTTLFVAALIFTGCGAKQLRADEFYVDDPDFHIDEEASIPDTTETREVLDVLWQYRQAIVNKDFGVLNRLVSDDYYENAGTTGTTADDYGRSELGEIFEMVAQSADEIRYQITVRDVQVRGTQAHVDYEFDYAFKFQVGDSVTWDAGADVNRLELAREGDRWRIVSGM